MALRARTVGAPRAPRHSTRPRAPALGHTRLRQHPTTLQPTSTRSAAIASFSIPRFQSAHGIPAGASCNRTRSTGAVPTAAAVAPAAAAAPAAACPACPSQAPHHPHQASQVPGPRPSRRRVLGLLASTCAGAAAAGLLPPGAPAAALSAPSYLQPLLPAAAPDLAAQLAGTAPVAFPGVAWALRNRDRQLYYPRWLEGEWEVTAKFVGASFPQGQRLVGRTVPGVLKGSMVTALPDVGAAMEQPLSYRARYGRAPEGGGAPGEGDGPGAALDVVADRSFNVQQLMDAFYGAPVTRRVDYEPGDNPTRMSVVYATPRRERSVISEDLRKAEIIINNRFSQVPPGDGSEFLCGELYRQISQASAQGFVGDYFVISRFSLQTAPGSPVTDAPSATGGQGAATAGFSNDGGGGGGDGGGVDGVGGGGARDVVRVRQRVAAFLQPQDAAYFEAGGQAVALYDYEYVYRRVG